MLNRSGWTDEQLIEAVKTSFSIAEVSRKLGVKPDGNSHQYVKRRIHTLNLDSSHFLGFRACLGKHKPYKRPIQYYLDNQGYISSTQLRKRLIKEAIFERKCYSCTLTKWLDCDIPLELDHIDGNNKNNNLSNLRLICPNCHAFSENYRGKNQRKYKERIEKEKSNPKTKYKTEFAKPLKIRKTKINWPVKEILEQLVWEKPTQRLAKELGVTDGAIQQHCKKHGISKPPRGYWMKVKNGVGED